MTLRGYLRQPTLRGDHLVFICDDDLWSVSARGGVARRLTAGLGEPSTPVLSPDGALLAYVSRDEKHPEVYVMPSTGGLARRLTYLGPDVMVRGFDEASNIVFVTTFGQPFFRNYRAFRIGTDGGLPELLKLGQVNHIERAAHGRCVIGRNTADPARWKRYRGGTAGVLWVDAEGSGQFQRLDRLQGNITSPMWIGERIYFLSDQEGTGNIYSCTPEGEDVVRHTDHDGLYARHAQHDGERIVYQCGGEIWMLQLDRQASAPLAIETPAQRQQLARKFVNVPAHLKAMQLDVHGERIALEVRGQIHQGGLWEGAMRALSARAGARERLSHWLADGSQVLISDASGEERLEHHGSAGVAGFDWDLGRVLSLVASPLGKRVALSNHRQEVLLADLEAGSIAVIDTSRFGRSDDLAFSADGRFLAYNLFISPRASAIKIYDIDHGTAHVVTDGGFRDYAPSFDPDGKFLYFLSVRTFDPVYDSVQFELSFPRAARPYVIALEAGSRSPFEPEPHHQRDGDDASQDDSDADAAPSAVSIDFAGIAARVAAFPLPEGLYAHLRAARGKVFFSEPGIASAHGRGGHREPPAKLSCYDFETLSAETWFERADAFTLSADAKMLAVRIKDRIRVVSTKVKPDDKKQERSETPSRASGWIDLDRVRVSVDPAAEWKQMLREVWRLQRDQFWVEDMSSIDWAGIYQLYAPMLERVATRAELSDLIWEMQGELGTSHAYEVGGDHRTPPALALGQLAADFELDKTQAGARISHLVRGDAWEDGASSPLLGLGAYLAEGDRILAVNGRAVDFCNPPQAHLVHQAAQRVELLVQQDAGTRLITVKTLADDVPARYREWVEANRAKVHKDSDGKVGYFHLPDMMAAGFAEFHRYFAGECDREGLIVDLRYNRGGHVSQLLLEKVARRRIGYDQSRWGQPAPYPSDAPLGPLVALTNEHAGSDGDIFSHCFKLMKLGPLVGRRTWGGVIGIHPRHALIDGSETTQPEFSFWFADVGWSVENYGTDPDIDVDNAPQDAAQNRDRQLERAIAVALERVREAAPALPDFGARPSLGRMPLPPRA